MDYNSILLSVKKTLGIDASYADFDPDIIMSINSAIHTLYQVGYEPAKNFIVESPEQTWETLAESGDGLLSVIKSYIFTKVRLLFDPPTSSFVLTALENQMKEFEWRIYAEMEGGFDEEVSDDGSDSGDEPEDDPDNPPGEDPWEGVPGNGPDEEDESGESELPDTLRRLRNEMGRP